MQYSSENKQKLSMIEMNYEEMKQFNFFNEEIKIIFAKHGF
jgi:hypothetical protein